jgi:hypothetical protein
MLFTVYRLMPMRRMTSAIAPAPTAFTVTVTEPVFWPVRRLTTEPGALALTVAVWPLGIVVRLITALVVTDWRFCLACQATLALRTMHWVCCVGQVILTSV